MAKIRHIVFHAADPERLARFYVDVMGLQIVHRAKNGGISLTDGYMNLSIHSNKMDGKPSGFNHFGFVVGDNEIAQRCQQLGYRVPLKRPGDRHYAECRAIDSDGNNFDISEKRLRANPPRRRQGGSSIASDRDTSMLRMRS